MSDQVVLAILGVFGTIVTGFFKLYKDQQKVHEKIASGMDKLAKSGEKQAKGMDKVAKATERAADEAKDRNGHLAEMQIQQADRIIDTVQNVQNQRIQTLEVENEVVENQTVKRKK